MAILMILFGLLFAVAGIYGSVRQLLLHSRGERVRGTVIRVERQWSLGGDTSGRYLYWPVLSFQTLAGQHIETRSGVGTSSPRVVPGQPVQVLYDSAKPSVAEIESSGRQALALLLPLAVALVGIGLAVGGIATTIG